MKKEKEIIQFHGKVYLYYSHKGFVLRYPTGVNWNSQKLPHNQKLIGNLLKKLRGIITDYRGEFGVTPSTDYVRSKMNTVELTNNDLLMNYYEDFLNFKKAEVENNNLKPQSIKDYNNLKTSLTDFVSTFSQEIQIKDITEEFVNKFKTFIIVKRGVNNNTAKKRLITLKIFLNFCEKKKNFKISFDYSNIKIQTYDPTIVTLSKEEVDKLANWENRKYEKAKDMFVFGCETSLRYSDIVTVRKHHIINGYIIKRSVKTNVQHIIPLNNRITTILEKYNYNLDLYENQPYNRMLKDMAKDSGLFDSDIIIFEQYGNKILEIKKKKWECIESHTARRTFITLKIMENVPINIIMANAGLKRLDMILHYMDKYGPVKKY